MNFFKKLFGNNRIANGKVSGFTLVELMVAISIYILMSVLLLVNQDKFDNSLSFSNLGYDIALTIRQAQTYGYAVRATSANSSTSFTNAFGVHFEADKPNSFIVFYEPVTNQALPFVGGPQPFNYCLGNGISCSPNQQVQVLSTYNLQNGYAISSLCSGVNNTCGAATKDSSCVSIDPSNTTNPNYLDVIFQRPNTNAFIFDPTQTNLPEAAIELQSPAGEKECVSIFESGDIEVSTSTAATPAS